MNTKKIRSTRKVIIKNPKLQAIRDNLRTIIMLAVLDEYNKIYKIQSLYLEKERISNKLTPSQFKRDCQLHELKEYLITTFSYSICISANYHRLDDIDITGDRVRYTEIVEFEKDLWAYLGARYYIQEQWFSLSYYEENRNFLENHQKMMKKRIELYPGKYITEMGLHNKDLKRIRTEFFGG